MVGSAQSICGHPIPQGLFLDTMGTHRRGIALGLGRRSDLGWLVRLGTSDYPKRLRVATGIGWQLPGLPEDARALDRNTQGAFPGGFAASHETASRLRSLRNGVAAAVALATGLSSASTEAESSCLGRSPTRPVTLHGRR